MAYKPVRTFNGTVGEASMGIGGPDQIEADIDIIDKMFNPDTIHNDGTPGGIDAGNMQDNAATDTKIGNRTVDQAIATAYANTGTLTQILSWIVKVILAMKGTVSNWYDAGAATIETIWGKINTHIIDYTLQIPWGGVTTNSGNDYSISQPAITALSASMAVSLQCNADSTGAVRLNWYGTGLKNVKNPNGSDVVNWKTDSIYTMRYNGINFILQGEGASGDAIASDLLSGKTATTDAGEITGTMPNNGSVGTQELHSEGEEYVIPLGYHNGLGKVKAVITNLIASVIKAGVTVGGILGTFTDDATAIASQILSGITAYVNGSKITGTMPNNTSEQTASAVTIDGTKLQFTVPEGYYNGSIQVANTDANRMAGNIKNGVSFDGLTGTLQNSMTIGDVLTQSADTPRNPNVNVYTKTKEITINCNANIRVKFDMKVSTAGYEAYGRVYKNGVAVGTERYTTLGTYTTYSEDFSGLVAGDNIQLYQHGVSIYGYQVYTRNFRIYSAEGPLSTVALD